MAGSDDRLYSSSERMTLQVGDRRFACIEYPGIVENAYNAFETLGGMKAVSKNISDDKKKLELRFRPTNVYSKPAYATSQKTAGLLMRVRRRKKQSFSDLQESMETGQDDGYEYKVEILGTVSTTVKFEGMCEFQYLPVVKKEDGSHENLLSKLTLNKLGSHSEYLTRDVPLFLPPLMFSRFDFPHDYGFKSDRYTDERSAIQPTETVTYARKKRQSHTTIVMFTDPVPTQASAEALKKAEKFRDSGLKEALEELFEERPVWSKAALMYRLRHNIHSRRQLKEVLPSLAYIFMTGPWRTFWVKLGYDPRVDPGAKKFQGVDVRRRPKDFDGITKIQAKRNMLKKRFPVGKRESSEINLSLLNEENDDTADNREPQLKDFEFHPDVLPAQRQVRYMVCDIFDTEVHDLASKNDGKETRCDERDGWCVPNFTSCCREIISMHLDKLCPDATALSLSTMKRNKRRKKLLESCQESDDEDVGNSLDAIGFEDSLI